MKRYPHQPVPTVDFETRSACSLKKCGTWRYAVDPTTEVLCLAFRMPHWVKGHTALWHPAFPTLDLLASPITDELDELLEWVEDGQPLEAHNAWFERCIWQNVLAPQHGFPLVDGSQWRCSAAKAAAHALPRALDLALAALKLGIRKDAEGSKVMMKLTKPRKPRKQELEDWNAVYPNQPHPMVYHESVELFERLWAYCRQDVLAEEALSHAVPDLSPEELDVYLLDQHINERGFQIDADAVDAALQLIREEQKRFNKELTALTGGRVKKATQREQMKLWFADEGLELENTQKGTLDDILANDRDVLGGTVVRGLELVRALGRSSTAKFTKMQDWMDPHDTRVRGGLLYHGASTGRWSGAGVQPQNFPRGTVEGVKELEPVWDVLKTRSRKRILEHYPDVMTILSHALRGAIVASPGMQLYVADYSSIEARMLLWLAEDEDALNIFRNKQDIYCEMASTIYNRPITEADDDERRMGKTAILGLGYQMGWRKFIDTAQMMAGVTIDEEMSKQVVEAYRSRFWRVKQLWQDQEEAAISALVIPGRTISAGRVCWYAQGRFLYAELPSGRRLAYPDAQTKLVRTSWGAEKPGLTFMGINPAIRKWIRQTTYGGMLVENLVQAASRDLMAAAMQRCEDSGLYWPVLSVHDEMLAEAPRGQGSVPEFEQLMTEIPPWAEGCPVAAKGWSGFRYRK